MINVIRKEQLLKKLVSIIFISLIITFGIFMNFQYKNLTNIYLEQNEINKRLVGVLVEKYPESEVDIVKAIYNAENKHTQLGEKTLDKFGYNKGYGMHKNVKYKKYLNHLLINNFVAFVIVLFLMLFIVLNSMKDIFNKLLKISVDIEKIINDDYILKDDFKEEGIFYRIYSDLNKLSRSLKLKVYKLDKEKESIKELVTDISHQLKTPLASLKLYNTLLIDEELDDECRLEFLKTNEVSINKLHNLIDSLVNISRLEVNMINIKKEKKSIKQTIVRAINSVKAKVDQKHISIKLYEFDDIKIPHDLKWTEESIFNVIDNAVKYTNEKGNINISVSETINFVRIDIQDSGIGIDKSEFNNIFKRFYRSEEVSEIDGIGVGLYLSRKILERQGGNIIVSSQKKQGSKFSLFLTKV
ncbi:sensor histidine kinase [Clostridium butyricum]|uniref:sensor histidine kinase n=1 Tax=Clostridium butyricum TaxID=1492 RepID=UPI0013D37401|nr:HAMP domain-containing sensor histidine kinase [Clostridium butyricum]MCQ2012672.1 HAMP domain-containing histidine kinase [Clostridium butyricum]MCQ2017031.1 HAMP domain-containing histidine kinase [Clostridium butyricum]MCQ2020931.1 HAMP domain-containing histidine kinase [Clostridium butyricum]MCQ2025082.1 HAMP domain-containing histidine kinase [Clostridium butyricum]NFB72072.1 HAMP domain-containing histidine kinase [Clostridium butyricum]